MRLVGIRSIRVYLYSEFDYKNLRLFLRGSGRCWIVSGTKKSGWRGERTPSQRKAAAEKNEFEEASVPLENINEIDCRVPPIPRGMVKDKPNLTRAEYQKKWREHRNFWDDYWTYGLTQGFLDPIRDLGRMSILLVAWRQVNDSLDAGENVPTADLQRLSKMFTELGFVYSPGQTVVIIDQEQLEHDSMVRTRRPKKEEPE